MAIVLYGLAWLMAPFFSAHAQTAVQLVALALLCGIGLVLYFALVHLSGAQPMGLLLRRLRRGA
jgi:putative peptidoglycan lipid II flippase